MQMFSVILVAFSGKSGGFKSFYHCVNMRKTSRCFFLIPEKRVTFLSSCLHGEGKRISHSYSCLNASCMHLCSSLGKKLVRAQS